MNPLAAISTMWRLGREASGALEAFEKTISGGGSIAEAVSAFAAKTDSTEMDDELADKLVQSLSLGVDYLGKTAELLATAAFMIEANGPEVISFCRSASITLTKWAMKAQEVRG